MAKELYLVSGLGADRRAFNFLDLNGYELIHINWIKPLREEKIESYASRLVHQITSKRPTMIGVSFGGIIAIEIAKLIETEKVILVSSVATKAGLPLRHRLAGKLYLNRLIPAQIYRKANFFVYWLFGITKKTEKDLLKGMMADADAEFVDWASNCVVNWTNESCPPNVVTVHGTADRIFPFQKADHAVENGGHLMVVSMADEVSRIIRKILDSN